MMTSNIKIVLVLLLPLSLTSRLPLSRGQEELIGCFVEGECYRSLYLDEEATEDEYACLDFCKGVDGCLYFTYFFDTSACVAFANCEELVEDCGDGCVSGDSVCESLVCFEPGQCLGTFVGTAVAADADDCLRQCQAAEDCLWFSFDASDGLCLQTRDCPTVDDCDTCVHGQVECQAEPSGSSSTTTSSTTITETTGTGTSTTVSTGTSTTTVTSEEPFTGSTQEPPPGPIFVKINCSSRL